MTNKRYPTPSDQQWEAIRATDEHLLVAASAGTGKTFTVVTKILYLLGVPIRGEVCPAPIQLTELAAITFTNKAAAELKGKLREALRNVGRRPEAYRVDGARIGTIHSFCSDILRQFALRTHRSPSLQMLEEAESIMLRGESVRDALLTALEDHRIEGLDEVLATYTVATVEREVARLLDQGNQLSALIDRTPDHAPRERAILELAALARDRMVERLDEAAQVDFDRIIGWTRDLIRDDATVRRALQRRIRVLFIDEFQDVDPAQREIAYLLGEPSSWRTNTTRLVLVGDPKQSIYRFRNADVTVWREVARDFDKSGWKGARVLPLAENRRSVAPILGFVDYTIGKLLDTPVGGGDGLQDFEIPYAPMTATRPDELHSSAIEIVTIPSHDGGKMRSAGETREIESRAMAARARELHEEGLKWHDIAVLLCGWGDAETYQAALRDLGIPTYILRDEGFYSCLEVTDVLIALDAIRNPWNDRTLFGFLRSPFVGLTDESLLRIVRQSESPCWSSLGTVTLADERERELLNRGFDLLTRLSAIRDRVSSAELIETLLAESGYVAHLELLGGDGKQRIANLRKLIRTARSMADESVGEFLDMVARQRDVEAREGESQLYGSNEDVVTITSVHCAKGLEWKVVFWCDLVRTPPPMNPGLLIGRDKILMKDLEDEDQPDYDALKKALDDERKAETKRLWYVAATRAKDLLVLSGIPLGSGRSIKGSPAEAFLNTFGGFGAPTVDYASDQGVRLTATVRSAPVEEHLAEVGGEVHAAAIGDINSLSKPRTRVVVPAGRGRHSATELLTMDRCERRHWFRYVAGLKEPSLRGVSAGDRGNAIRRGLIVHDVLENYEEEMELGVLLEAAIGRWDPDAPPPEATRGARFRRRLMSGIETILASPQYRAVLDRDGARRELAFANARAVGEYTEGKIDLIAPGADGYSVVDVKASECDEEAAQRKAEQYGPQRASYSQAIEAISGMPVADFAFQFAGDGAHVAVTRGEEERVADARRVDGLLQLARGASRELTRLPAECRFCGYKAEGWCPGVLDPNGAEALVAPSHRLLKH